MGSGRASSAHCTGTGSIGNFSANQESANQENDVMPGQKRVFAPDVPGIHVLAMLKRGKTWMAGASPAKTG